ncbi:helix-turn-helix domain-containing protein [Streptomyces sp. NPDC059828]|uniref:helix-turn-helix domain-containing protein n=1 Tax=Streptomyces sp. NPDC059828 TaxID=3346965 RepID=UPI003657E739
MRRSAPDPAENAHHAVNAKTAKNADDLPSPKERRRLRESKSLSEEELAQAVGVTRATVRSWETGRTNPRGRKREAYAKVLASYQAELTAKEEAKAQAEREARWAEATRGGNDAGGRGGTEDTLELPKIDAEYPPAAQARQQPGKTAGAGDQPGKTAGAGEQPGRTREPRNMREPGRTGASGSTGGPERAPEAAAHASRRGDRGHSHLAQLAAQLLRPSPYPVGEPPPRTAEQAFDVLYRRTVSCLVRQTYLLTGNRDFALEAVEYAFHRAWQRWPEVAVDPDPPGWLRAAAYEYAMSPWHRLRRGNPSEPDPPEHQKTPGDAGGSARQALRDSLLALPPMYRRTLLLYDALGLDLPETAAETEASTPAAATRLLNARAAVAERIPELREPDALHERLAELAAAIPAPEPAPASEVRACSEKRTQFWTRASYGLAAAVLGASLLTMIFGRASYEAPRNPGRSVGGVPSNPGPMAESPGSPDLRLTLREHPMKGPARLTPRTG